MVETNEKSVCLDEKKKKKKGGEKAEAGSRWRQPGSGEAQPRIQAFLSFH